MQRLQFELFFEYGSPTSYLAYHQVPAIQERTNAVCIYRPFVLAGVFKMTGNSSPASIPAKAKYLNLDIARHAKALGLPYLPNPHFPLPTAGLMRGALHALARHEFRVYSDAVFDAIWAGAENVSDTAVLTRVLERTGLQAEEYVRASADEEYGLELRANTEEAVARGAFGAPTFFVDGTMYWGQDRVKDVTDHLLQLEKTA